MKHFLITLALTFCVSGDILLIKDGNATVAAIYAKDRAIWVKGNGSPLQVNSDQDVEAYPIPGKEWVIEIPRSSK